MSSTQERDCWQESLPVASPCGLGFLRVWEPQGSGAPKSPFTNQSGKSCNITHVYSVGDKWFVSPSYSRRRDLNLFSSVGDWQCWRLQYAMLLKKKSFYNIKMFLISPKVYFLFLPPSWHHQALCPSHSRQQEGVNGFPFLSYHHL